MNQLRKYQKGSAVATIIGALIILVLSLYCLVMLIASSDQIDHEEASAVSINTRIMPAGFVKVGDGVEPGNRTGDEIFTKICFQCHAADAVMKGSPKLGNQGEWAPLIASGMDVLLDRAINGYNAMPARGGASDLTDEEVERAIAYMANESGGNFTPPAILDEDSEGSDEDSTDSEPSDNA